MICLLFGHSETTQEGAGDCAGIVSTFCQNCGKVFSVDGDPKSIERRRQQLAQRGGYEAVRERMG